VPGSDLSAAYAAAVAGAGGRWSAYVAAVGPRGGAEPLIEGDADRVVEAASVQKLAVAVAVLAKVDDGDLALDRRLRLRPEDVLGGSGLYHLQPVWGDELTLANVLTALLLVSDNTAVRLCGQVCPGPEVNERLAALGCAYTRVRPLPDQPHRFFLGETTARETAGLLRGLTDGTLLSLASRAFLLGVLRAPSGYHDGVRRRMSSAERSRVATLRGADEDRRHEVGLVVGEDASRTLVYAFLADGLTEPDDYGGTHPAVRAHAALGRALLDAADAQDPDTAPPARP
jgi:beta-lactamase class A